MRFLPAVLCTIAILAASSDVFSAAHTGGWLNALLGNTLVPTALQAAEQLEKEGISCEVIDPRTIRPLDINMIVESVKKTNRAVVAEESHPFACRLSAVLRSPRARH